MGDTDFFVSRVSNRASVGSSLLIPLVHALNSTSQKVDSVAKDDLIKDETLVTELYRGSAIGNDDDDGTKRWAILDYYRASIIGGCQSTRGRKEKGPSLDLVSDQLCAT